MKKADIGLIGLAIYGQGHFADVEHIMPTLANDLLPTWLAGIFISGAIAAMISTADSLLILSATEFHENILKPFSKKLSLQNKKQTLTLSRIITASLAVIALFLAWLNGDNKFIFTLVSYVWAGIGGTFSVVVLFTLFWKKYNGKAVITTIIYGITFTIVWINTGMEDVISSRITTFTTTLIVGFVATLIFDKNTKK